MANTSYSNSHNNKTPTPTPTRKKRGLAVPGDANGFNWGITAVDRGRMSPRWKPHTSQYRANQIAKQSLRVIRTSPNNPIFGPRLTDEEIKQRIRMGW